MAVRVDISKALAKLKLTKEEVDTKIVDFLQAVGDRFVDVAHQTKAFQNRTGNLSASIGYGLFIGGSMVRSGGFGDGEGGTVGRTILAGKSVGDSPTLIVVAGMEYASYVERSGYAVLDGARVRIDSIVDSLIATLKQ